MCGQFNSILVFNFYEIQFFYIKNEANQQILAYIISVIKLLLKYLIRDYNIVIFIFSML